MLFYTVARWGKNKHSSRYTMQRLKHAVTERLNTRHEDALTIHGHIRIHEDTVIHEYTATTFAKMALSSPASHGRANDVARRSHRLDAADECEHSFVIPAMSG